MNVKTRASVSAASSDATAAGRLCPLRYRYGAAALRATEARSVQTLYVVGGLYGNLPALDTVERMAKLEAQPPTVCFNGDFNWFDVADQHFAEANRRVLLHDAIQGNVEAELGADSDDAGCGCGYPEDVDAATVDRSNQIHHLLKTTAARHPAVRSRIAQLPMFARYAVAGLTVGVVHGDADSLAGWRFDVAALADEANAAWLRAAFEAADVDVFASTHTCLPAVRRMALHSGRPGLVVNNGAAGMPNFAGDLRGLCTRIGGTPSPHRTVHETRVGAAYVALLPLAYDTARWRSMFLQQWPPGTAAWLSYFERIERGTRFTLREALLPPMLAA